MERNVTSSQKKDKRKEFRLVSKNMVVGHLLVMKISRKKLLKQN